MTRVPPRAGRSIAALGLAASVGAAASPAAACGYHGGSGLGLGMLNLAFPDALHVRTAVWMAQQDGTLAPPTAAREAPDEASARLLAMRRYRETVQSLDALRARLERTRDGAPAPSFSMVLIGSLLWARYDASAAQVAMCAHVDGPRRDDVVLVTDAPVVAALVDGRLSPAAARERGLIRLYGAADATRGVADELARQHATRWNRAPSADVFATLVDAWVRDEVLYREGIALGLDRDDPVIKRRVRQKVELMAEELLASDAPTDAQLADYMARHPERFVRPARIDFEQVFFDGTRAQAGIERDVADARDALSRGADPDGFGQPTLLPRRIVDMPVDLVAREWENERRLLSAAQSQERMRPRYRIEVEPGLPAPAPPRERKP